MTPEERNKLNEVYNFIQSLKRTNTVPLDLDQALTDRFKLKSKLTATATGTASTQQVTVSSTPSDITVPAQPSGTLKVNWRGTDYELLYK